MQKTIVKNEHEGLKMKLVEFSVQIIVALLLLIK